MKCINKNFTTNLILTYLLILAFKGFQYASGDLVEVLSYAKHIQNNILFNSDFYVSHIASEIPNERIIFSTLLSLMGSGLAYFPFVLHLIFTLFFLTGLYKVISIFVKTESLKWISILILLGPLYKFNLGGNEMYYNMFISSYTAKVFGIWAIYYFISFKRATSFILLIFATLLHPTVGSQLFIIFSSYLVLDRLFLEKNKIKIFTFISIIFYLLINGIYIYLLLNNNYKNGITDKEYFDIFEFRIPHHYFPQYFPLKSYLIETSLFIVGIYLMYKAKMKNLFLLSTIIILGIIVYIIGAMVVQKPLFLNTQWFKSTIWLELFSLISIIAFVDNNEKISKLKQDGRRVFYLYLAFTFLVWIMVVGGVSYFKQKPYQLFRGMNLSEEEKLGLEINKITKGSDLFIYPVEFTGFKIYSERNAYIDYKSVVHRRDAFGIWYSRINEIYGIDLNTRRSRKDMYRVAKKNYSQMNVDKIEFFKSAGIDYIVQYKDVDLNLPVIFENNYFKVYKIN